VDTCTLPSLANWLGKPLLHRSRCCDVGVCIISYDGTICYMHSVDRSPWIIFGYTSRFLYTCTALILIFDLYLCRACLDREVPNVLTGISLILLSFARSLIVEREEVLRSEILTVPFD
jgi:hypothetical protein